MASEYGTIRYATCKHQLTLIFIKPLSKVHNTFSNRTLTSIAVNLLKLNRIQSGHPSCIKKDRLSCYHFYFWLAGGSYRVKNNLSISPCLTVSGMWPHLVQSKIACKPLTAVQTKKRKMFSPHRTSGTFS